MMMIKSWGHMPVIQRFVARRYHQSALRYVMFPVICGVLAMIPPVTLYFL